MILMYPYVKCYRSNYKNGPEFVKIISFYPYGLTLEKHAI